MTHPDRINIIRIAALALSLSLAGCGGGDGAPSDGAGNAVSPEREKAAEQAAAAFDAAVATENWPLAKAQGDVFWPITRTPPPPDASRRSTRKSRPKPRVHASRRTWRRCGPTTTNR